MRGMQGQRGQRHTLTELKAPGSPTPPTLGPPRTPPGPAPRAPPTQGAFWENETLALHGTPALGRQPSQAPPTGGLQHPRSSRGLLAPQVSGPHVGSALPLGRDLAVPLGPRLRVPRIFLLRVPPVLALKITLIRGWCCPMNRRGHSARCVSRTTREKNVIRRTTAVTAAVAARLSGENLPQAPPVSQAGARGETRGQRRRRPPRPEGPLRAPEAGTGFPEQVAVRLGGGAAQASCWRGAGGSPCRTVGGLA